MKKRMLLIVAFVLLCLVGCEDKTPKEEVTVSVTPSPAITSIVIGDLEIVTPMVTPGVENTRMPYPNTEFVTEEYTDTDCSEICDRIVITKCVDKDSGEETLYEYAMYSGEEVLYHRWTETAHEGRYFYVWEEVGGVKRPLKQVIYQYAWEYVKDITEYTYTDFGYTMSRRVYDDNKVLTERELAEYDTDGNMTYQACYDVSDVGTREEYYVDGELAYVVRDFGWGLALEGADGESILEESDGADNDSKIVLAGEEVIYSDYGWWNEDAEGEDWRERKFMNEVIWQRHTYDGMLPDGSSPADVTEWTLYGVSGTNYFPGEEGYVEETQYPVPEGWKEFLPPEELPTSVEVTFHDSYTKVSRLDEEGNCYRTDNYTLEGVLRRSEWTECLTDGTQVGCVLYGESEQTIMHFAGVSFGDAEMTWVYMDGLGRLRLNIRDCFGNDLIYAFPELSEMPSYQYDCKSDDEGKVLWQRYDIGSTRYEVQYEYDEEGRCTEVILLRDAEPYHQWNRYYPKNGDGCYCVLKAYYDVGDCNFFIYLSDGREVYYSY